MDALKESPSVYSTLDDSARQFRLVELLPGQRNEPIRARLKVHSADDPPHYEALSYEWGESTYSRIIWVDGRPFAVRDNLYRCLQQLRPPTEQPSKLLFIDAMCINQDDVQERNEQVRLMGAIYQHASLVRTWLGEAADDSDTVIYTATAVHVRAHHERPDDLAFAYLQIYKSLIVNGDGMVRALQSLFRRSYWHRLWIVQEIVLAKQVVVHCGDQAIDFDTLVLVFNVFVNVVDVQGLDIQTFRQAYRQSGGPDFWETKPLDDQDTAARIAALMYWRQTVDMESCQLEDAVMAFSMASCKVRHDKVFGFLGLISNYDPASSVLQPDYAMMPERLFFQVMDICSPIDAVKLGSVVLDALGLRSKLDFMRSENDCEKAVEQSECSEKRYEALTILVGSISQHVRVPDGSNSPAANTDEQLHQRFEVNLKFSAQQPTNYINFQTRAVFLEDKHLLTKSKVQPGDQIYWISWTNHVIIYRPDPAHDNLLRRMGKGRLVDKTDFQPSSSRLPRHFLKYLLLPPKQDNCFPIEVTRNELLWLLETERSLSPDEFVDELYRTKIQAFRAKMSRDEEEGEGEEHVASDVQAEITALNDHFRDMRTLQMIDEALKKDKAGRSLLRRGWAALVEMFRRPLR